MYARRPRLGSPRGLRGSQVHPPERVNVDLRRSADEAWRGVVGAAAASDRPAPGRPGLDAAYASRASVTVAAVSSTTRGIRSEVPLGKRDKLPRPCAVQADNLYTIEKRLLDERITTLTRARIEQLDAALRYALGLDG